MNRSTQALVAELARAYPFPDPRASDGRGLLAYGGDLAPERLLAAYAQGVFPWYDEPPILWFSPDPRHVLRPSELRVSRTVIDHVMNSQEAIVSLDAANDQRFDLSQSIAAHHVRSIKR